MITYTIEVNVQVWASGKDGMVLVPLSEAPPQIQMAAMHVSQAASDTLAMRCGEVTHSADMEVE